MPRDKYSCSPSTSKKSKKSRSRERDYRHKSSKKSKRSRDYSREREDSRRRRSRDRYKRHTRSSSIDRSSESPIHSSRSSSYSKHGKYDRSKSRSQSRGTSQIPCAPPAPFISERYNFEDACSTLDLKNSGQEARAEIERNEFVPKTFSSSATKLPEKVKIDLDKEIISIPVPPMPNEKPEVDPLIHPDFCGDEKARMERWIKKLLSYRHRMDVS